jgi:hypothetical protein
MLMLRMAVLKKEASILKSNWLCKIPEFCWPVTLRLSLSRSVARDPYNLPSCFAGATMLFASWPKSQVIQSGSSWWPEPVLEASPLHCQNWKSNG